MSFYRGIVIAMIPDLATWSGHAVHQSQQYGCSSHRLQSLNMLAQQVRYCVDQPTLMLICNIYIYPVTMVSVVYHCGSSVIYPQFELAVKHLGINHYCSLSPMTKHFSCLPISHS